ncbi:hypothetical protein ACFE04_029857 [Oxalis oulophora]
MAYPLRLPSSSSLLLHQLSSTETYLVSSYTYFRCRESQSLVSSLSRTQQTQPISFRVSYRYSSTDDNQEEEGDGDCSFNEAVLLFNKREYYKCHDLLEALWIKAEDPTRTLLHGILQCAVGLHHLFNKNHKGAMMELGEGLCKLRKMNFKSGPFLHFEQEISATLDFIYQTQLELAACGDDMCVAMDRSERSYQLLGGYAAGQEIYCLELDSKNAMLYVVFSPKPQRSSFEPPRVKLPTLTATEDHLLAYI